MQSEELYYDHYRETFERQREFLNERNSLTLYLIVLVTVIFLMLNNRSMMIDVSSAIQIQNIGQSVIDFNIISSILYFSFMWLTLRYYQINLTIENNYEYLGCCEKRLSQAGTYTINREGSNYEKDYPLLKWLAHRIYVYLFPVLVVVVSIVGICHECGNAKAYRTLNTILLTLVIIITILYLIDRIRE